MVIPVFNMFPDHRAKLCFVRGRAALQRQLVLLVTSDRVVLLLFMFRRLLDGNVKPARLPCIAARLEMAVGKIIII